ncbi:DNA phosphorothioation-associated putative methyltransferase [Micromonospora lupini]|uniref:DNA phosphorothioation-associated putative methyltransferase n=1 Tax=Micromonospora lupini TaxID=285679 RepID=UPI0031E08386
MDATQVVPRHLTAIARPDLSKPVALALADGIIAPSLTVFDYGCGRGDDVTRLKVLGYEAHGWDPGHCPDSRIRSADVVNLGYVVNVIEDPAERARVLRTAWSLARHVLVVAARPDWEARNVAGKRHGDGILTNRGTFQKFFRQEELQAWLQSELKASFVAAAPGIFYVFRDESRAQSLLASRVTRRYAPMHCPDIRRAVYETHREEMDALRGFVETRGRLPELRELPGATAHLIASFSSIKRAAAVLRQVIGAEEWDHRLESARERARQDLLVYLAFAAFSGRPKAANLPKEVALDVKALFGSYRTACDQADQLLHCVADQQALNATCRQSRVGKLTAEALYVHTSGLDLLSPLLRIYEACARVLTGTVTEANIVKLSRTAPKVSYLTYPDFDRNPHPALATSLHVDLNLLRVRYVDFRESANPPILHRKETFVPTDHPSHAKFAYLTRQEERAGLLRDSAGIGTRERWQSRLDELGYRLHGHRVIRKK